MGGELCAEGIKDSTEEDGGTEVDDPRRLEDGNNIRGTLEAVDDGT